MTWIALEKAIESLNEGVRVMKRNNAVMQMRLPNNPYLPLIRVMLKLELIAEWQEPFKF